MNAQLREVLSENGTLSTGRVASILALVSVIIWVSYIVIKTNVIPGLGDCTLFITTPYAASKAATAVQSFSKKPVQDNGIKKAVK